MTGPDWNGDLLMRLRRGDEQAFLALYHKLQPPIYRFARNMTGSTAVAEDVTQEVFLALLREDFGYVPDRGTLSGYLFGIARKLVLRHLERNHGAAEQEIGSLEAGRGERLGSAAFADPIVELLQREGIEELRRAVLSLPRRYREVVVLCDLEETDYAVAADLLGCPVGTVRSRLHRARALLLEKLQPRRDSRSRIKHFDVARSVI
ncbi:MAG: RNA polymerase sigma factor [Acidobacteriia bacterium]|nr:RNA polymerase sigma factor [Terriglobia bacterium]MBV8903891.1 RNA polymerase sigma factor [Terriglobia bacterium]